MACLALLLPYNTGHQRLQDQSGNSCARQLPNDPWFRAKLQQHGLLDLLKRRNQSLVCAELNERQTGFIVKLVPDILFEGPLTRWDKECKLLWEYLQFPADGYSLRIAGCCKFVQPVSVATVQQRIHRAVWYPDVRVRFENVQAVCVTDISNRPFAFAELPRVLGIENRLWDDFCRKPLCLSMPYAIVELIGRGSWSKVLMRASWANRKSVALSHFTELLGFPPNDWVDSLRRSDRLGSFAPPPALSFGAAQASKIAETLRSFAPLALDNLQDDDDRAGQQFELEQMVCQLDSLVTSAKPPPPLQRVDANLLVSSLAGAMHLKDRSRLRAVVRSVFTAAFPECEADEAAWSRLPSGPTLSRSQMLLDAALCCYMRKQFLELRASIFMLADASPQAGHDYLLSTCLMINHATLERCAEAAKTMKASWDVFVDAYSRDDHASMMEVVAQRQQWGEILKETLTVHRLLPMGLGSGATSLDHKARAIARAMLAETQSLPALRQTLMQVTSVTTDLGTESGLADLNGLLLKEIVPNWVACRVCAWC